MMITDWRYPTLYSGILRRRYKRFLAEIQLATGETLLAHCPNTGPMQGVCQIGSRRSGEKKSGGFFVDFWPGVAYI